MKLDEFLRTVITTPEGYLCLATRSIEGVTGTVHANGTNGKALWSEQWFTWPNEAAKIAATAVEESQASNVYFSAHLFSEKRSIKAAVLPSRTIQADLDHAAIATIPVIPSIVVNTSPNRHQGYWILDKVLESDKLEAYSRRVAYGVPDCDKTGWTAGHKVRLPNTYNYKYETPSKIEVSGISLRNLGLDSFDLFPDIQVDLAAAKADIAWLEEELPEFDVTALELLVNLKQHLPPRVYTQYTKVARDRSAALWALMCECFKMGCSRDQVLYLAHYSANNKFSDRRYHGLRDLRSDVLRAESTANTAQIDLKALVMQLRQDKDIAPARKLKIAQVVINHMRETGEFVHCKGGALYWLRRDTGRPVLVASHSEWLNAYLISTFGLNPTESEQRFVIHEVISYVKNTPATDDLNALSSYDPHRNLIMIHTGGRDVVHISTSSIDVHPNGYGSTVFQWTMGFESFNYSSEAFEDDLRIIKDASESGSVYAWHEVLFKDMLYNVVGLDRIEALVVLRAWFLFLVLRTATNVRPILALYGQPGSAKTTIAKLFYRLIYGRYKSVSGITNSDDFDMSVCTQPFITFDNLDTWVQWLPDKLALCASDSDVERRKLYTDSDVIMMRRQALVALTAHNPKFSREDITDRLLLFTFQRLSHFKSETEFLERISDLRNSLWASIFLDLQRLLNTSKPVTAMIPQFRIEDFASMGAWISKAHSDGYATLFKSAVDKIQSKQRSFNLEEDQMLLGAIFAYFNKPDPKDTYDTATTWWNRLTLTTPEPATFIKQYRDPRTFAKKLWIMQDSLKDAVNIEWEDNKTLRVRTWRITK
ncbi:MAG TPA: hypothetical protein VLG09_03100, partial [Candidatus Saccharimonadales bacterium]|nr:hypothetical protein [Candidatus Saccharimonadales bacterium]